MGAGGLSAIAAAFFLTLGDPAAALAQQVPAAMPVIVQTSAPIVQQTAPQGAAPLAKPSLPARILGWVLPAAAPSPAAMPLAALVDAQAAGPELDEQGNCLATAVYFESMGEPLEGQLAVAQVVINRARSGRYPSSWCAVIKQKAQFSFVRSGRFPRIDLAGKAWRKARAIAAIAANGMAQSLPADVLWYHADYVAPGWGRRLNRVNKIGAHIFYRA